MVFIHPIASGFVRPSTPKKTTNQSTNEKWPASEPNLLKMRYKHRGTVERRNCSPLVARRRGGVPHHHLSAGSGPVLPGHHHLPPPPPLHHRQAPPPAHSSSVALAAKRMSQLTSNRRYSTNTHLVIEYFNDYPLPTPFPFHSRSDHIFRFI
jgi:hypothetical protein